MTAPTPPTIATWDRAGHKTAVDFVAREWITRSEDWLDPLVTLRWLEQTVVERVRSGGLLNLMNIIAAAEDDDYVADRALTLAFHSMINAGERPPAHLSTYMAKRDLGQAPHRKPGGHSPHEHVRRNYALAVMMMLACEVFDLRPTRNRAARRAQRPCGASLVAAAAAQSGFDVSESRLTNLWAVHGPTVVRDARSYARKKLGLPAA
jgi:hypothetical protein